MPTGDKQQPIAAKKVALRELPNETRNIFMKPPGNSPLPKDRGTILDVAKVSGIKRQQSSCSSSPSRPPPPGNTSSNGHLVYVRRKLETEAGKMTASDNMDRANSPSTWKANNDGTRESKVLKEAAVETKVSPSSVCTPIPPASLNDSSGEPSLVLSLGKPNESAVPEPCRSTGTAGIAVQSSPQRPSDQHWKERFLRLQEFLKNCDQSNQEEYIQNLRSLSAVGRSRHAVDLEKRAIQLLLEEGKELQRMKILNVLGKASPMSQASVSTQTHSFMPIVQGK